MCFIVTFTWMILMTQPSDSALWPCGPGPCRPTPIWRCRNAFSQWQKAALPLSHIIMTASYRSCKTGPACKALRVGLKIDLVHTELALWAITMISPALKIHKYLQLDFLFNSSFSLTVKETSKLRIIGLVFGESIVDRRIDNSYGHTIKL